MPQGASSEAVQALVARWHGTQNFHSTAPEHLPRLAADEGPNLAFLFCNRLCRR